MILGLISTKKFLTQLTIFFVDVIFDNIFTDLRVNREIKEIREKLEDLGDRVDELLRKIN